MAARSKASVCGRSPAEIVGSNPTEGMDVCCECCVLSGRGLCDELITRPEETYRPCCVVETSRMRRPWPTGRLSHQKQINKRLLLLVWGHYINSVRYDCFASRTDWQPMHISVKSSWEISCVITECIWNVSQTLCHLHQVLMCTAAGYQSLFSWQALLFAVEPRLGALGHIWGQKYDNFGLPRDERAVRHQSTVILAVTRCNTWGTECEALQFFDVFLLIIFCHPKLFAAPILNTHSQWHFCVLPFAWETKFHNHTKWQVECYLCVL